MLQAHLLSSFAHIGLALRQPEEFAVAWNSGSARYRWSVWVSLFLTAVFGTATYGMTMGLLGSAHDVFYKGAACTLGAGLAWGMPLPALYILNSLAGSKLKLSSTFLAALVTTSWGGLAMIASIPVNWFFSVAVPHSSVVLLVNLGVFLGVGVAMMDVFNRVMRSLEPDRDAPPSWWLLLVGAIGIELYCFFGLFNFGFVAG